MRSDRVGNERTLLDPETWTMVPYSAEWQAEIENIVGWLYTDAVRWGVC